MSVVQLSERKALTGGFYTVDEAARILGIENATKVRRWIGGGAGSAPVIQRQYDRGDELGFLDLLEVRFVEYFRRQGVSLQSIRAAAAKLRAELEQAHPFALSNVTFVTDRKRIFSLAAREVGDERLIDIVTGQHAMYDVIEAYLAKGVGFAPSGLAKDWRPEPSAYPNVLLHPLRAHGQPIIDTAGVTTSALFSLWRAEGQDYDRVADWFETDRDLVMQAIEYELKLAA